MTSRCGWCGYHEKPAYANRRRCSQCGSLRSERISALLFIQWVRVMSGRELIAHAKKAAVPKDDGRAGE